MSNKIRNISPFSIKIFLIIFMMLTIIIPLFFGSIKTYSHVDYNNEDINENFLNPSEFTKENYTAILDKEKHGLGNITVDDIRFNELRLGFVVYNESYPLLWEDFESEALKVDVIEMKFIETTSPAIRDNLDDEIKDKVTVTVRVNETLNVSYNNPNEGYLIYHSNFPQTKLIEFYVVNRTVITNLTAGVDYTTDDKDFIVFHYKRYFREGPIFNFTMHLIWKMELGIGDWEIVQKYNDSLIMREEEQEFTPEFNYKFFLIGRTYGADLKESDIAIDFWDIALTVNLPDKEELENHELILNLDEVNINTHLNPDKSITIKLSDYFTPNYSIFFLNFTSTFRLRFEEPAGKSWAIDRLVADRDIREKIYFISLISGPQHIYLKQISFFERGIYFDQVINNNSLFNRNVAFFDLNASILEESGLRVTIPYLIEGETCPFSLKYQANHTLNIFIADNIKMPLVGANIEVFHFNITFGTYISIKHVQPLYPGKSDENGQVVLYNVPNGNYTIKVYWKGEFVKEAYVTTLKEINYIYTNVPHFPLWIIIFGIINGIIILIGVLFYLKYKKLR